MGQLVVVLDEDDSVFDAVAKPLEDAGYLVLPISTSYGIIDELKDTMAAALLLDLRTNDAAPGADVLTLVAQDPELGSMPVLAYAADVDLLETVLPRLEARGHGALPKPLVIDDVLRWLRLHAG